ncbi:uncharacterized protein LOC111006938 [Momordica charantia]|uniref:Uncharacterized protein LOC111006938 n=1 Tax=Momordica charantia TaxID=3673 RepID=A0A6J1C0G4_MOMCH|nr:uncharacterized protein LOC111006938 [Momordica charantia]
MMLHNNSGPEDEEELISYLQRRGSATLSGSSTWKIRTNELAQHEFRRERRAAAAAIAARKLSYEDLLSSEDGNQQQFPVCLNALSYSSASSSSSSAASSSPLGQDFKQQKRMHGPGTELEQSAQRHMYGPEFLPYAHSGPVEAGLHK